jgi:hypothetical protein
MVACSPAASSPYAVFRASDLAWSRTWAPPASIALASSSSPPASPPASPPPSRPRKRLARASVIQGELFALQPNVLPFQPQSRPGTSSKPM